MRIVGLLVVGPYEADRYLDRTLADFRRLCDTAHIVLNRPDPRTEAMVSASGYPYYPDNREWGVDQPRIKQQLAHAALNHDAPDWLLPLDADECFTPALDRRALECLCQGERDAYYFYRVALIGDEQHFAPALSDWNVRLYRAEAAREHGTEFVPQGVHCGIAPAWFYTHAGFAPYPLLHHGFRSYGDRMLKRSRYGKYDPQRKLAPPGYYKALYGQPPMVHWSAPPQQEQ